MGHPNTKKHKAQHGGYRNKPTGKEVQANLDFWSILSSVEIKPRAVRVEAGVQLKLDL